MLDLNTSDLKAIFILTAIFKLFFIKYIIVFYSEWTFCIKYLGEIKKAQNGSCFSVQEKC